MRSTTSQAIHAALIPGPKTQDQIARATGLNRNTVIRALSELGIPWQLNTWPRVYTLDPDTPTLPPPIDGIVVPRNPTDPARPWPARWDAAREQFGTDVATTRILAASNPRQLAATFLKGASSLASIAEALTAVADKPDWYTLVGGEIEDLKLVVDNSESTEVS